MNDSIIGNFEKLEEQKVKILFFLASQDSARLEMIKAGSWSMIQTVRHVQMSEESIISYMEKKINAGDDMIEESMKDRFLLSLLSLVFFLRIKFKAPDIIANPPITSLEKLESDWNVTRERMRAFITKYPIKWQKKAVYRHPIGFRASLKGALKFFNIHQKNHINQVYRINKSLRS